MGRSSGVLCYMPVRRNLPRVKVLLLKKPLIQLPKSILVAIPFQQDFSLGKSQPPVLCMFLRDLHGRWIHLDRKAVLWNYEDTLAPEFSSRHILHSIDACESRRMNEWSGGILASSQASRLAASNGASVSTPPPEIACQKSSGESLRLKMAYVIPVGLLLYGKTRT